MNLIALIIVLLVFCVLIWAARTLMAAFGVGEPISTVVYVLLVLIVLVWLLNMLGLVGLGGGPVLRVR